MPKNFSRYNKAIIAGWNLKKMDFWRNVIPRIISTPYGKVSYFALKKCIFIPRHGINENLPPHKINHRANIFAIKKLSIRHIFSFNSVGSLKNRIKAGDFIIASDYIDFNPPTFFEKEACFIVPEFSLKLRRRLADILHKLRFPFYNKGVYFLTKGPRLETKAEISILKSSADIVGMTMAKEATLASELGLEYVSLCVADNYANGIAKKPISTEVIKKNQLKTKEKLEKVIKKIIDVPLN